MNVTFVNFGEKLASSRLRAKIPQEELGKLGVKIGNDVVVYGKHFLSDDLLRPYKKRVYDITDDHFNTENLREYYLKHTLEADVVTCSSEVLKQIIKAETGRNAIVIKEPYEGEERTPEFGNKLLWFGHRSNLPDILRLKLDYPLLILSNHQDYQQWTPESFKQAISTPCIVVIPTGKSMAKSENRMVESIRQGRYVCAEYLPAYEPFEQFFPIGDIPEHIEQALSNPDASKDKIHQAQDYIRDRYSPETIGKQWLEVINAI